MIQIYADDTNDAWNKTVTGLLTTGTDTGNDKYYRDEPIVIEIDKPVLTPVDPRFPMSQRQIDTINHYIVTGEREADVSHAWTKLYYHRTFDEPNSQIEFLINTLSADNPIGESQISMWDKNVDQYQDVCPCTQIIWARIKHNKLELHVHTNSSDAYKKLLMNIQEFVAVQHYIADRIHLPVGKYVHFIDSCHIYRKDLTAVNQTFDAVKI